MYVILDLLEIPRDKLTPAERGELMVATVDLRNVSFLLPWKDVAHHIAWPADYPLPDPIIDGPALKRLTKVIDKLYDKYVENV